MVYEGELDALSGWEAYPNWAHISLPHGAASAKKDNFLITLKKL
jgi:twinkle protein